MALNTLKCSHLTALGLKGLNGIASCNVRQIHVVTVTSAEFSPSHRVPVGVSPADAALTQFLLTSTGLDGR